MTFKVLKISIGPDAIPGAAAPAGTEGRTARSESPPLCALLTSLGAATALAMQGPHPLCHTAGGGAELVVQFSLGGPYGGKH